MEIGLVGLPNVGKSTLFNALTAAGAAAENFPFCTIEPNVGVAPLPDARLARLTEIFRPEKTTPAAVRFVDIAGLARGAHEGEGLGNQFLHHIRQVDAVAQVVRAFEDDNVTHVEGSVDPVRDMETIATELGLADLATVERRLEKTRKQAKADPKSVAAEVAFLERLHAHLAAGRPARTVVANDAERKILRDLFLLTAKPTLYVANVAEEDLAGETPFVEAVRARAVEEGAEVVVVSAKIEAEAAELSSEERRAFLAELGVETSGIERLARAGFRLLERIVFFTGGPKEVRAWEVRRGSTAPEAAGVIHSDFEKHFIRAEVVSFEDLDALGAWEAAREAAKLRIEGRDYVVADGDVCHFRVGA